MQTYLIFFFCLFFLSENKAQIAKGSIENSKIEWLGKKTGGSHSGTIDIEAINISYKNNLLDKVELRIDMQSISCTDLQGKDKDKLESHLKQASFFNVSSHRYAFFESDSIVYDEKGSVKLSGKLKIKDIEKEIGFGLIEEKLSNSLVRYEGKVILDRGHYNLSLSAGGIFESLVDKLVDDEFELFVDLLVNVD